MATAANEAAGQSAALACGLVLVGRGGGGPPTFHFSGGRSYRLSYLPERVELYRSTAVAPNPDPLRGSRLVGWEACTATSSTRSCGSSGPWPASASRRTRTVVP